MGMRREAGAAHRNAGANLERQEARERHVIIAAEKRARTLLEGLIRS
jgi:hypothetical protein